MSDKSYKQTADDMRIAAAMMRKMGEVREDLSYVMALNDRSIVNAPTCKTQLNRPTGWARIEQITNWKREL